jgi:hypothetical protein
MFALVFAAVCLATTAKAEDVQKLNTLCKEAGARIVADEATEPHRIFTAEGTKAHFSFSTTIDACVGIRIDYLRNEWAIEDVFGTFVDILDNSLFNCSKSGVDNMLLDAVRRLNGRVSKEPYRNYLDDGEGGPPVVTPTDHHHNGTASKEQPPPPSHSGTVSKEQPSPPPSRDKCEGLFKKKLAELRLVDEPKW